MMFYITYSTFKLLLTGLFPWNKVYWHEDEEGSIEAAVSDANGNVSNVFIWYGLTTDINDFNSHRVSGNEAPVLVSDDCAALAAKHPLV